MMGKYNSFSAFYRKVMAFYGEVLVLYPKLESLRGSANNLLAHNKKRTWLKKGF